RGPACGHADQPACACLDRGEQLVVGPRGRERVLRALLRPLDELEETVQLEQLLPRFPFELAPPREGLLGELDELRLWVREADDAVLEDAALSYRARAENVSWTKVRVPRRVRDDRLPRVVHVGQIAV